MWYFFSEYGQYRSSEAAFAEIVLFWTSQGNSKTVGETFAGKGHQGICLFGGNWYFIGNYLCN